MIKAAAEIYVAIQNADSDEEAEDIIVEYGWSIVDECANIVLATRPDTSTQDITELKDRIK